MHGYDHKKIETKWQKAWAKKGLYKTSDKVKGKDNFYLLVEFPYPSGNLHVGHWYAFSVPDILARMMRMQGRNVLYPIGFDAFGLPAENAAIKNRVNPRKWTLGNIEFMKKQIRSMGTSFDWSREILTCDPAYYKWTQWLFLQFFKRGLAYQKETPANWCPKDKTVLANEQVVDGKCERCGTQVIQKEMPQWNLKITDYADRLINDLDALDWPEQIKESQRNWIGRSEGYEIDFPLVFDDGKKYKYVLLHGYTGHASDARWQWIRRELEALGHEVIIPELPNTDDPSEEEQVEVALHATEYDERTVLFGHSLGATVAMKVVEKLTAPISRLVLAGAVVNPRFKDKKRPFEKKFSWRFDPEAIKKNAKSITVLHDPRDYAITEKQRQLIENMLNLKARLCSTTEPHFTGDREPDLLMWLRPTIRVFTTRPDTLYGGTFLVLAPEHPWIKAALQNDGHRKSVISNEAEIQRYVENAAKKTERERQESKEKTGVELMGVKAINPTTGAEIPLWVADYALMGFGTGALFAKKYGIPLRETIEPLFIQETGLDKIRSDEPFTERNSIHAFVKHWSDEKYMAVHYVPSDINECVSGGIEEGEDAVTAAQREIREETGYSKARFVRKLGNRVHAKYYSVERKKNMFVHFTPLLFQLEDDTQEEISASEKARHEVSWLSKEEVGRFFNRDDIRLGWSRVENDIPYEGKGILFDSGEFSGLTSDEAMPKIGEKFGRLVKHYRLRDWIVSRQRYWGVPIPIIHCATCGPVAVPDKDLPVKLPEVRDYLPDGKGKSPLAKVIKFVQVKCPRCKSSAQRETDTLDTFVDSSWYFLRYTDPKNKKKFADANKMDHWMPVDLYSGGAEHTTMHVLYSRFWQKAMFDLGLVKDKEPYVRRMNRSIILGPDGQKMSKSHGNVIDPDEVVARLGADTVRMYLAFIGPYSEVSSFPWNPDGVVGVRRFLERVWNAGQKLAVQEKRVDALRHILHKTVKKVGDDIIALKFNTAISQLMIFLNAAEKEKKIGKEQWETFLRLLAPFAPHMTDELWHSAGRKRSVHMESWPKYDESLLKDERMTMAVQINGKTRGEVTLASDSDKTVQEQAARSVVATRLQGKNVLRAIVVPGRLVNFVVAD
jgi:leucyl-tRNA synthetase